MIEPINRSIVREVFANMAGRVTYEMGAKVSPLDCDSADVRTVDCSGLVQYLVARGSGGQLQLPEGSDGQREWALARGLERHSYSSVAGQTDNVLRLCFISAEKSQSERGNQSARHAFFVFNGGTMESHGRDAHGDGCDSRPWDTPVLLLCDFCFVFPSHP